MNNEYQTPHPHPDPHLRHVEFKTRSMNTIIHNPLYYVSRPVCVIRLFQG